MYQKRLQDNRLKMSGEDVMKKNSKKYAENFAGKKKSSNFAAQKRGHPRIHTDDSLAQLVEHNTFNVGVVGSSPTRITTQAAHLNGAPQLFRDMGQKA